MPKSRKRRSSTRRAKPGARGSGGFFHIQVRPKSEFVTFRNQDVGARGGIERVAGRRANGSWDTQKWLIGKSEAHRAGKSSSPIPRPHAKCCPTRLDAAPSRRRPFHRQAAPQNPRQPKSRHRRCAARNSPTSRKRKPRAQETGGPAHDPQAGGGKYRLYSRKKNPRTGKRRNLGTFTSRKAAEQHERDVQYFKRH